MLQELPQLKIINLSNSKELNEFPDLSNARNLKEVYLTYCSSLTELPDSIGHLLSLETLYLSGTNVETLPTSIKNSSQLRKLLLNSCKRLWSLQELPSSIEYLNVYDCTSLEMLSFNSRPINLVELRLNCSKLRRSWDVIQVYITFC